MKKCWLIITLLLAILIINVNHAEAASIPISGNKASDAIITDQNGKTYTDTDDLNQGEQYNVTYHWSLPNNVQVQAGDTATFFLPGNLKMTGNDTFDIHLGNNNGPVIGTFTIKKNARTGTLTFNNYFQQHPHAIDREGIITFGAWSQTTGEPIIDNNDNWHINKTRWYAQNADDTINKNDAYWNFDFNPQMKHYDSVTITDTMSANQSVIPGSVNIIFGQFSNENVVGQPVNDPAKYYSINGNVITFHFTNLNQAVNVYYQVKPNDTSSTIDNSATMITDSGTWSDNAELNPGNGIASDKGDFDFQKINANNGQPITGQVIKNAFELVNVDTKQIYFADLNANGTVSFSRLPD